MKRGINYFWGEIPQIEPKLAGGVTLRLKPDLEEKIISDIYELVKGEFPDDEFHCNYDGYGSCGHRVIFNGAAASFGYGLARRLQRDRGLYVLDVREGEVPPEEKEKPNTIVINSVDFLSRYGFSKELLSQTQTRL